MSTSDPVVEKTKVLTHPFYLISPQSVFFVEKDVIIGRAFADFNLEDERVSASHCKLILKGVDIFIVDLESTNGVFVNELKIFPNTEHKLNYGDKILIGNTQFVLSRTKFLNTPKDNAPEEKKIFNVPVQWQILYTSVILISVINFVFHLTLEIPLSGPISFLSSLYSDLVLKDGLKAVLIVVATCMGHALLSTHLVKARGAQTVLAIPVLVSFFLLNNFKYGPAAPIKKYLIHREIILGNEKNKTAITQLKELMSSEVNVVEAYGSLSNMVTTEQKSILDNDLDQIKIKVRERQLEN